MKKVLKNSIATIVMVTITSTAFAQFSIGARGGIHLANWTVNEALEDDVEDPEFRLSPLIGVLAEFRFNDYIAVQPEINFLQKGFKKEETFSDPILGEASGRTDFIFNHIEIPVLFKGGGAFGPVRIDGIVGPGISYALNGKTKYKITVNGNTETETEDIDFEDDEFSRTDLSIHIGAVISVGIGETIKIFADTRYLSGFVNLNSSDSPEEARNYGISISAGVLMAL